MEEKTIIMQLNEIVDEICDNYCKYAAQLLPKNPCDEVDALEEMLYEQYCANCPLTRRI